ncbi:hypothetical protein SAMN05192534_12377 [Alteribacillus persepolensis]|uniref:DUF2634 domain-containing protein n=1 Tax=Alteribacillus persepolensis TaxID=568899 RepID=A0A1G8IBF3_9BACI|nr:hypothetical protein [Alteribacillus persepolensis]SDI16265.1 hypothetical protein SAMN05192534_12377 [Alteribacillus persepolensis]
MKALQVDHTGDIVMQNGQLQEVRGIDEIQQRFRQLLRTNKDEWFLDPEEGFDYSVIQGKNVNENDVQAALDDVADQMDEIESIENVNLDFDRSARKLTVFFVAVLADGDTFEIQEVL